MCVLEISTRVVEFGKARDLGILNKYTSHHDESFEQI
jgi:hypothetical protein